MDTARQILYVVNPTSGSVTVFNNPSTRLATAQDALIGLTTGVAPHPVCSDGAHDRLYYGDPGNQRIDIITSISTLGSTFLGTPANRLGGLTGPGSMVRDSATDDLYVVDSPAVKVFANSSALTGAISPPPTRTLTNGAVMTSPVGVALDPKP